MIDTCSVNTRVLMMRLFFIVGRGVTVWQTENKFIVSSSCYSRFYVFSSSKNQQETKPFCRAIFSFIYCGCGKAKHRTISFAAEVSMHEIYIHGKPYENRPFL